MPVEAEHRHPKYEVRWQQRSLVSALLTSETLALERFALAKHTNLSADRLRCILVIPRDDNDPDASVSAVLDGAFHLWARRIL